MLFTTVSCEKSTALLSNADHSASQPSITVSVVRVQLMIKRKSKERKPHQSAVHAQPPPASATRRRPVHDSLANATSPRSMIRQRTATSDRLESSVEHSTYAQIARHFAAPHPAHLLPCLPYRRTVSIYVSHVSCFQDPDARNQRTLVGRAQRSKPGVLTAI